MHVVAVVIPLLGLLMTAALFVGVRRSGAVPAGLIVGVIGWWLVSGALAATGVLARFDARPPPIALFMPVCIGLGLGLGLSDVGRRLATTIPLHMLVLVQAFRLPLELAMHAAGVDGIMPMELSFSGYNFDIVTGAGAVVVGVLHWRGIGGRGLVMAWNVVGIAALVTIVAIALLTSPMIHFFGTDPAHLNTWVSQLPYVWLPAILVATAIAGHVVVTRALLARR